MLLKLNAFLIYTQPDVVMHLAAESHVDRSIKGPGEFIQTNIIGTYQLLEQSRVYYSNLGMEEKVNSDFTTSLQMKFMEIYRKLRIFLLKKHLTIRAHRIQRQRQVQII